ncbi:MAG: hypothetical protein AUH84_00440 [Thaumarchaeota archaeon 13_1_40CM_4_38_7]|nr:MAG: hypothetical protein AUH84_00440 [Thaumarchaeota archaeon 13_1_40CM_4_38_7]
MIKAVITSAGRGVRLLPMTKEMPKEMMPIFSKIHGNQRIVLPLLQLIFEQLYSCNLRDYCFIVGRGKRSIEDHFTIDHHFRNTLSNKNRKIISNFYERLENSHLVWINQDKPRGFGDAVRMAQRFVGQDNFIVHAGDVSILSGRIHPILRLIKAGEDPSVSAVLLFRKVKDPERHGIPTLKKISKNLFLVEEVEEKPDKPKSNIGLMPLYFFTPRIFDALKKIRLGKGKEYQLTDAIQKLIEHGEKIVAIPLSSVEKVLDVGTVDSYKCSQESSYRYA